MNERLDSLIRNVLDARKPKKQPTLTGTSLLKRVSAKSLSYTERHRGQWFRPEYNLAEIQIAQDEEGFLFRAIQKKVNRFMIAGYEFHGKNPETVEYVEQRVAEIELVSNIPFSLLIRDTVHDLNRFSNCMWAKVRDPEASTGEKRVDLSGVELDPVAGYFVLPFECLEFKTKPNGEIKKVMQRMPSGETREFHPRDLVHFYVNKKPGFCIGTPEMLPVIEDLSLLRRVEELCEELIETNLFPTYHYKIGSDEIPERYGPDGTKESDVVKRTLEYMPSGGFYVSDHRHNIEVLGSESKALRIDFYLKYFNARAFAGMGVSGVDMGEGDSANKSTAGTLSKSLIQDVEAMQETMKTFLEFFVIGELLWEGGYNPLDKEDRVEIKFGIIDREEQTKLENQVIQLMHGKALTVGESRKRLGYPSYKDEDYDDTYQRRFEEPLALLKGMGPGTAASETLAESEGSAVSPEAVAHEEQFAKQQAKEAAKAKAATAKKAGNPGSRSSSTGSSRAGKAKARPSNQSGTRSGPKMSKDGIATVYRDYGGVCPATLDAILGLYERELDTLEALVTERVRESNCSRELVCANLAYRFKRLYQDYLDRARTAGLEAQLKDNQ